MKFQPIFKTRLWGGRNLARVFNKALPPGQAIGESWELVDLPEDRSIVANGPWQGQTLHDVICHYPQAVLGRPRGGSPFPLLIKLLDAQDILSVQVHPDEATCRRRGQGDPKTECWYIIDAAPGAFIYKGLQPGVTRAKFAQAIERGKAESLLCKIAVVPGECHFLPAGTVHAVGSGLLIAEVQLPSDTTYRLYDFNRLDAQGHSRPLHIDEGLESIHWDQTPDELPVTTTGCLVDCAYFKVHKEHQGPGDQTRLGQGNMVVLVHLSGTGTLTGDFDEVAVRAGDCLLVPAACAAVYQCEQETCFLTVTL